MTAIDATDLFRFTGLTVRDFINAGILWTLIYIAVLIRRIVINLEARETREHRRLQRKVGDNRGGNVS